MRSLTTIPKLLALVAPIAIVFAAASFATTSAGETLASPTLDDAFPPRDVALPDAFLDARGRPDVAFDARRPDAIPVPPDVNPPVADARPPIPPDPTPLAAEALFVIGFRYANRTFTIARVRRESLPKPAAVPRRFGRFAAELYVGPTLLERIRFDVPLLHDDDQASESYEKGLDITVDVKLPDSDRPTRLEVWDRATDRRWRFAYPPK
jgi:hypothetical protein